MHECRSIEIGIAIEIGIDYCDHPVARNNKCKNGREDGTGCAQNMQ